MAQNHNINLTCLYYILKRDFYLKTSLSLAEHLHDKKILINP